MITTETRKWTKETGWTEPATPLSNDPQLVFVFGDRTLVSQQEMFDQVKEMYANAYIILIGSTSGNILNDEVSEESLTISAVHFEKTRVWYAETTITNEFDSKNVGRKLAEFLPTEDLVHSFILSDGLSINGSDLVRSVNQFLPSDVTVTGGLAGDSDKFEETLVGCNGIPQKNKVALIGFYSDSLKVGYASEGGWSPTADNFMITRSKGNVLYELSGEPALDVYKRLLGDKAKDLPASGLLFPLELTLPSEGKAVRTILSINEEEKSITFAGDMPENVKAFVMNSTEDALIESAFNAGRDSVVSLAPEAAQYALLVSCVGRKLVLKDRTEEEVAAVRKALGDQCAMHGFYSYGELCPGTSTGKACLLHNQTMTVTTFAEV